MNFAVYESLQDLPREISSRFDYANVGNFFLSTEWFECLNETVMRSSHDTRIYVAIADGGEPLGITVCGRPRGGASLRGLTSYYTADYRPIIAANGVGAQLLPELVAHVAGERPRWSSIELDYLRNDRPDAAEVAQLLQAAGFAVDRSHRYDNWFLPVRDRSFADFYASRPSQMRNTIARREKKLLKAHRVDIGLATAPTDDLERRIQDYVAVYNSSWKGEEPYPRFIPELARTCAKLGILRLGVLSVDATPAASQLWITHGGTALIYKLAYDEKFAEYSVGSILSREMFRTAIDVDRVHEIDYGVGSESYKRDWMSDVRVVERITAANLRHPLGLASACIDAGKRLAKKVLRKETRAKQ